MNRIDNRANSELRPTTITIDFMKTASGSCLIETGNTRVICTASVEENVPPFLRNSGKGWVTAEYAMLPASTGRRKQRDGLKKDGRSVEIQRLIGRSLRQAVDLTKLGERTITLDCDVLEADGGTRTASITGAYVALVLAVDALCKQGILTENPIIHQVAAISAGIVENEAMLDLCYHEDSKALTDMNVVMTDEGTFIELQGTGEGRAFSNIELSQILAFGRKGVRALMRAQRKALQGRGDALLPKPTVVVASGNAHKIEEISALLGGAYRLLPMNQVGFCVDIVENGATFEENACIKAETVMQAVGLPVLADDSGICVEALQGAPGIYSARYAGKHGDDASNNQKLLAEMENVSNRTCSFQCAMALAMPGEATQCVVGECKGTLLRNYQGDGGFGYDPLFEVTTGISFAQLSQTEKNAISHRGNASRAMHELLQEAMGI